jgi:hypothetical protein
MKIEDKIDIARSDDYISLETNEHMIYYGYEITRETEDEDDAPWLFVIIKKRDKDSCFTGERIFEITAEELDTDVSYDVVDTFLKGIAYAIEKGFISIIDLINAKRTYTTKYDKGDYVWIIHDKSVLKTRIQKIRITDMGKHHRLVNPEKIEFHGGVFIEYLVEVNEEEYGEHGSVKCDLEWVNELDVYPTKEKLIESIK